MKGLIKARREKHLTQAQVAEALNIKRSALSHYENGKRDPNLKTLKMLSDFLKVSIDYLINGEEFQTKSTED